MCLDLIRESRPVNADVVKAYKLVCAAPDSMGNRCLNTPFQWSQLRLGEPWKKATNGTRDKKGFRAYSKQVGGGFTYYPAGFHAFVSRRGARKYAAENGYNLVEVELKCVRTVGIDRGRKTYVATYQRAIREISVFPKFRKKKP